MNTSHWTRSHFVRLAIALDKESKECTAVAGVSTEDDPSCRDSFKRRADIARQLCDEVVAFPWPQYAPGEDE